MGRFENDVFVRIEELFLGLGRLTPEREDHRISTITQPPNDGVGEGFPAFAAMRVCLVGTNRHYGVEEQHSLPRPGNQATVLWRGETKVIIEFLENVAQRGRQSSARQYRKTQTVRLADAMIGVLAEDYNARLLGRSPFQGRKNMYLGREDLMLGAFDFEKLCQATEVGFCQFVSDNGNPGRGHNHDAPTFLLSFPGARPRS